MLVETILLVMRAGTVLLARRRWSVQILGAVLLLLGFAGLATVSSVAASSVRDESGRTLAARSAGLAAGIGTSVFVSLPETLVSRTGHAARRGAGRVVDRTLVGLSTGSGNVRDGPVETVDHAWTLFDSAVTRTFAGVLERPYAGPYGELLRARGRSSGRSGSTARRSWRTSRSPTNARRGGARPGSVGPS